MKENNMPEVAVDGWSNEEMKKFIEIRITQKI